MPDTLIRRLGHLAILLGLVSLGLLVASVWGFRAQGWPWPQSYQLAAWGAWTAIAGSVIALAGGAVWLGRGRGGAGGGLRGLMLSLPVGALGIAFEVAARTTPPINDISTDIEDPPVFWFTVTPSDYPSQNAEAQRAAYPEVRSLDLPLAAEKAVSAVLERVNARVWEILSAHPEDTQIEAIARSRLFGFEDEVAIRLSEIDTGIRIDMRSRSRIGRIDRGANARRIEAFLAELSQRVMK